MLVGYVIEYLFLCWLLEHLHTVTLPCFAHGIGPLVATQVKGQPARVPQYRHNSFFTGI